MIKERKLEMNHKLSVLAFALAFTIFSGFAIQEIVWTDVGFTYDSGRPMKHAVGDTLIDNTTPDTVYFSLDRKYYPVALSVIIASTDLNSGENMTIRLDKGAAGVYAAGTLDTAVTAGSVGFREYAWSAADPAAEDFRVIINQLASAAATDCLSYRLKIKQKLQR